MDHATGGKSLPDNAYRELKEGEEYHPVMPAKIAFPEVTGYSVFWGLVMAVIFSAASAYSGLKIGQVLEAAIPISIIAVGLSTAMKKKNALGQNVMIQSIGASSGVIVAGAIFTIPALYILDLNVDFFKIFFSSLLGGFLGILFLIPFRRYFVKDMHGKFPFPEATATTEILITGEKGGMQAGVLIISGLVGGIYDFMFSSLGFWKEAFTSRILPIGEKLATDAKMLFTFNISSLIVGFGFLVGLKFATIIVVGSLLSWFVLVPLLAAIGDILVANGGGVNMFADMSPEKIFVDYVRHIGIGAIAMAGIIGIVKSYKIIGSAFTLAINGIFGSKSAVAEPERTDKDIKMTFIMLLSLGTMIAIFIFFMTGVENVTWSQALAAFFTVTIISFLFTTVAANAIAIVGSNPVSGMTLMTLILSSFILSQVGLQGETGMTSAIVIGGVVCTALSMAGGFITDLKVGYWLGSTPMKQQSYKFLGTLISAATVGAVIFILSETYGFVETAATPDPLIAPQANAVAAVIQPLMSPEAQVNWMLYIVGAVIAILINWVGISPLAFALGMYLPLELNTPLIVGGLIAHFVKKNKNEKLGKARSERGTLIASGFIAGAAIFGVLGAIIKYVLGLMGMKDLSIANWGAPHWPESMGAEWLGVFMFALLMVYFVWHTMSAKEQD
jgi:putative OPT family oligopeptide transporter